MAYMVTLTVSQARSTLPELLDRVEQGEEVTITRHGRPVAVVVRPDALRSRRADGVFAATERLQASLAAARHRPLDEAIASSGITVERADELIAAIEAGKGPLP